MCTIRLCATSIVFQVAGCGHVGHTRRHAIDLALVAIFVGYAVAILLLMRRGADALPLAPFEGAVPAYRAILFAAFALLFSAAVDAFVWWQLAWSRCSWPAHWPPSRANRARPGVSAPCSPR